jgi:DNA-binding NarL/FixJ family response regulator
MSVIRIVLAEEHGIIRAGLKALIDAQPDMEVVADADDGAATLAQIDATRPALVLTDLQLQELTALELCQRLRGRASAPRVLILSAQQDVACVRRALEAGASGYILKRASPAVLLDAIRSVAGGGVAIDPAVEPALAEQAIGGNGAGESAILSEREGGVLRLIAQGYSNKEIAAQLDLSVKTVETYKARAMEKLALGSRVDIVRYANEQGWLNARAMS